MSLPVIVSRLQNRRGTQSEFDSLYPEGYTGSGGVDINQYPGILLPGELALCTDSRSIYMGNLDGEYIQLQHGIDEIELLPVASTLYPTDVFTEIPALSFAPTSFFNIDYSITDSDNLNWNTPGVFFAKNGSLQITSVVQTIYSLGNSSDASIAVLTDIGTEINQLDKSISFIAQVNSTGNRINILYKHNFSTNLILQTATKKWVPFITETPPMASSITPSSGPISGGTTITITGVNFTNLVSLTINNVSANNIVLVSDTEIIAETPPSEVLTANVVINTLNGTFSTSSLFTYT